MNAKIINFKRTKKQRARGEARQQADENAVKFGRTKAQKDTEAKLAELDKRRLDGAKRDVQ